jgi:DNA-binding IclR family transcriptional regulator
MIEIFGSRVKAVILLYLGLRGGSSGRNLARTLKIHASQVFKALNLLLKGKILRRYGRDLYALNPDYVHHETLLRMIEEEARQHPSLVKAFLPVIPREREVDPLSVYRLLELQGRRTSSTRLSDVLRERYG